MCQGNFLLLNEDENSPLKAVDFGLAVMWERDEQLPRTDLGLDGTPWFMAPEVIGESETYPASDVWSAGVMCYQLLSGKLPFDDASNRQQPSLSLVWRSILMEDVSFAGREWANVSGSAKKFVMRLLNKDPNKRPTANEALRDPWLLCACQTRKDRLEPLDLTVVQRLQRFAQANLLQRTILELVASELVKTISREGWLPDETVRGVGGSSVGGLEGVGTPSTPVGAGVSGGVGGVGGVQSAGGLERRDSKGDELVFPMSPEAIGGLQTPGSVPGLRPFGHSGRSDQSSATHPVPISPINNNLTSPERRRLTPASSFKRSSGQSYDWKAMRLASDLVLQGSGHRQSHYLHACSGLDDEERLEQRKAARLSLDPSVHGSNAIALQAPQRSPAANSPFLPASGTGGGESQRKESGRSVGFVFPNDIDATDSASPVPSASTTPGSNWGQSQEKSLEKGVRGRSLALEALQSTSSAGGSVVTNPVAVAPLMKKVGFRRGKVMTKSSLMRGLDHLGYSVEEDELASLMSRVGLHDDSDGIQEAEFLATQLDWRELQRNNKQVWLECAKKAFEELDDSATGHINIEKVLGNLRTKLPDDEIDYAVEDALVDANLKDPEQVDFESFVKLVTIGSHASLDGLDKFPDRVSTREPPLRDLEQRPSSATIHEATDEGQQDMLS